MYSASAVNNVTAHSTDETQLDQNSCYAVAIRYQCRESRLIATIVYYPIAFISNCSGTADQLTGFSFNVSTSEFSVVDLEDVAWVPWKHPLNN